MSGELSFPFKRYQIGKVYRGEKAQAGRYREFYQCDIDIIGDGNLNIMYDAELPSVIYTTFKSLGFDKFTICISNRKILNGLFESLELKQVSVQILRIIDKIEKIGKENVKKELEALEIDYNKIETIIEFISIDGSSFEKIERLKSFEVNSDLFYEGVSELDKVITLLKNVYKIPERNYKVDLSLARGLDYYTGTIYETFLDDYRKIGSVCSGGRYDNLAEYYTDKKFPGVGISIGLTRFFYQMKKENILKQENKSIAKVLVIPMSENEISYALEVAKELRNNEISTDIFIEDKKLKSKFKYADKLNIPFVAVVGEEEEKNKNVTLKNMVTGEQEVLDVNEILNKVS